VGAPRIASDPWRGRDLVIGTRHSGSPRRAREASADLRVRLPDFSPSRLREGS